MHQVGFWPIPDLLLKIMVYLKNYPNTLLCHKIMVQIAQSHIIAQLLVIITLMDYKAYNLFHAVQNEHIKYKQKYIIAYDAKHETRE